MVPGEKNPVVLAKPVDDADDEEQNTEEPVVRCIVNCNFDTQDGQDIHERPAIFSLSFPPAASADELVEEIGRRISYHPDSFIVQLLRKPRKPIVIQRGMNVTIEDLGLKTEKRNVLSVCERNDTTNKPAVEANDTVSSNDTSILSTYVPPPPPPPPYSSGSTDYLYNYSYPNALIKQDTGYVGLVNQAMTCYLNSLLQTLYMTPEFRNALYRWEFIGTEEEGIKSVPFQLQKLFLQLQTSSHSAIETKQLTTSFGWDSSEGWQQHDIQELCRVMFDALEQTFKNTEQADLINNLYEGKMKDYVKCLECDYESAREDTFLDVPLVVRPFGSSQAYESVEEALQAFVTPEILQGSNQYFCEQCNKKCDAHKGLKFMKFPYLLTLHLKRFDFDPVTMLRIKLNDKVKFPQILNINNFIEEDVEEAVHDVIGTTAALVEGLRSSGDSESGISIFPVKSSEMEDTADDDEGIDVGMNVSPDGLNREITTNEKNLQKSMEKGPYVYELFSIMVHQGSSNGGHYYAYIKAFADGQWYSFNDNLVSKISYDDIQKTYGGYCPNSYSSTSTAYMLMYRQIDKAKNAECMSADEFPDHIKKLLQTMKVQEERERQQRELDRSMCKIKLFCQHPVKKRMVEMVLKIHEDRTLAEATATARTIMGLDSDVPLDCCRLVKYDDLHDSLECSFDGMDGESIGELLGGVKTNYKFDLLLETKNPGQVFQEYKPGGTTIKIHVVDLKGEDVRPASLTIRCNPNETVGGLKNEIAKALNINANTLRVVFDNYKLLENNSKSLSSEGFRRSSKVFIEYQDQEDAQKPFLQSQLYSILECYAQRICVHIVLPKVDKALVEKLSKNDMDGEREDSNSEDEEAKVLGINGPPSGSMGHLIPKSNTDLHNKLHTVSQHADCSNLVTTQGNPQSLWISESRNQSSNIELAKKSHPTITPDDSSQDYDEGLGDSEIGESCLSNVYQSCQTVHSDQSEDSSCTDSERTLVGDELSPRNNSPDIMGSDPDIDPPQSPDAAVSEFDSAHSSDSNRAELSCEGGESSSEEGSAKNSKCSAQTYTLCESCEEVIVKRFFRAWPYTDFETGEKMLRVYVDKRTSLAAFKKELEPFVGVCSDNFKIHRVYSSNQEFECTGLNESLASFTDDTRLTVKLERELRKGEYKVKIYQLCINNSEPIKFLNDYVFVKGMTVLQVKKAILPDVKDLCNLEVPLNRCRLRRKSWKNPGAVFLDHQKFGKDLSINARSSNWEMFFEVLEEPETVTSVADTPIFIKRWYPSSYKLGPFQEIVLNSQTVECLRTKISEASDIPKEYIEFAKGQGTFPCDVSVLSIHKELDWLSSKSAMNKWGVCLRDDGLVVYYRDSREEMKKLSEEEKKEITNKENARSHKVYKNTFSPRKEKALKIYTHDNVSSKSSNSTFNSAGLGVSSKLVVPDLD